MKKQLTDDMIKSVFSGRLGNKVRTSKAKELRCYLDKIKTAIKRKAYNSRQKCTIYPYWCFEVSPDTRLREYPHLTVLTNVSPDGQTCIKLLKIELDSGSRMPERLMRKMIGLTGYGLVLCPADNRFKIFIDSYKTLAKTEKIVTDGIFFGLTNAVLRHGVLGPTFTSLEGSKVIFRAI